jgi:N-acyl homoserine lactone hydrolase
MTIRSDLKGSQPSIAGGLAVHPLVAGHVSVRQRQVRGIGSGGMRRLNVLRDKTWTSPLPILAWAIEHPEGLIVVDTGEVSEGTDPKHYPASNPYLRRATRFEVSREDEVDRQLTRIGLSSEQVRWGLVLDTDGLPPVRW